MIFSSDTLFFFHVFPKYYTNNVEIQYCMIVIDFIVRFTKQCVDYFMNISSNRIVETSNLQQSYTQYLYSIQIVKNNYSKPGAALVNTISSVSQYRLICPDALAENLNRRKCYKREFPHPPPHPEFASCCWFYDNAIPMTLFSHF